MQSPVNKAEPPRITDTLHDIRPERDDVAVSAGRAAEHETTRERMAAKEKNLNESREKSLIASYLFRPQNYEKYISGAIISEIEGYVYRL